MRRGHRNKMESLVLKVDGFKFKVTSRGTVRHTYPNFLTAMKREATLLGLSRQEAEKAHPYVIEEFISHRIGLDQGCLEQRSRVRKLGAHLISKLPVQPARGRKPKSLDALPMLPSGRPPPAAKEAFYDSWEWRTVRMQALRAHGAMCQCCGARRGDLDMSGHPVRIVVDHIKPLSRYWELRLDPSNLQILCEECNMGKGAWDETDWRPSGAGDVEAAAA